MGMARQKAFGFKGGHAAHARSRHRLAENIIANIASRKNTFKTGLG